MSDGVFVGLDLGTSSLKGVAVSATGAELAVAQAGYATRRVAPGRAEQEPAEWLRATVEVVRALSRAVVPQRWRGIGLSGMIPTLVLEDQGAATGPALTWEDDRAQDEGDAFREEHGADELYRATGQWIDGRYLIPMWRWTRRRMPDRAARVTHVLSAKDFLFGWLTGEPATDPSTATGFGCFELASGAWSPDLAGDVLRLLPEVRPSTSASPLSPAAAAALDLEAGLPVCVGAADSVAGVLALGAGAPGDCAYLWGTSTVIVGVSGDQLRDPDHRYLVTPLAVGEAWGLEMDLVSTGSAIGWLARLFGADGDEDAVLDLAASSEPGSNGIAFLPYLGSGEQGALWDPALRGTIAGLTLAHARQDLARALFEGIALESRRCIGVLDEAGVAPRELSAAGVAIGSSFFVEMLAGASGRPVSRPDVGASASARGAALLAGIAVDHLDPVGLIGGRDAMRIEPDSSSESFWRRLAERHDRLLAAIRPANEGGRP